MQKTTPNPIDAVKTTIYNTKHTQNTKTYFQTSPENEKQIEMFQKKNKIYYYIPNFHSSYFLYTKQFIKQNTLKTPKYISRTLSKSKKKNEN